MDEQIHNVIIIGGGCAGLAAAIYCGRAELKPVVFWVNMKIRWIINENINSRKLSRIS